MLGLALCGGGVKCMAHLGALKVFQRHGVGFDVLAGSSAGALVAVAYALGWDLDALEEQASLLRWRQVLGCRPGRYGVGDPGCFLRFLHGITGGARLETLPKKVLVTATDLTSGRLYVFDRGDAATAIYASCALPGLVPPLPHEGRLLVDGSVLAPLPANLLRRHGARTCVGIFFGAGSAGAPRSVLGVFRRCFQLMMDNLAAGTLGDVDLLVTPGVGGCGTLDFRSLHRCLGAGERAAEQALPALQRLLRPAALEDPATRTRTGGAGGPAPFQWQPGSDSVAAPLPQAPGLE